MSLDRQYTYTKGTSSVADPELTPVKIVDPNLDQTEKKSTELDLFGSGWVANAAAVATSRGAPSSPETILCTFGDGVGCLSNLVARRGRQRPFCDYLGSVGFCVVPLLTCLEKSQLMNKEIRR